MHSTFSSDRLSSQFLSLFFLMTPPPPSSTLFPYTTLFRSHLRQPQLRPYAVNPLHRPRESPFPPGSAGSVGPFNLNRDRKSTRLNSSHVEISYAVFCLKKKKKERPIHILVKTMTDNLRQVD